MVTINEADCLGPFPRATVSRYEPAGKVADNSVTISFAVELTTVRGSRSRVTNGGVIRRGGLGDLSRGDAKLTPLMTSR
jgi:hypothetical protein